jgi:hypothetical protein
VLNIVQEALSRAGVLTPQSRLTCNITITTGDAISMEVLDDISGKWYHVKASRFTNLGTHFERYKLGRQHYPSLAPEPITHVHIDGWSIMATYSIDHRCVVAQDLGGNSPSNLLVQDLVSYFSAARLLANEDAALDYQHHLLKELHSYFTATTPPPQKILKFLKTDDLIPIPTIPQHGDFVLNNLGDAHGRLVIFDWEDYGELMLAGFDIFMLSMSVAGMNASSAITIAQTTHPNATPWAFAEPACVAIGLSYDSFRKMVPLYLVAFRYLKRNYGLEIRERVDVMLNNILP